MKTKNHRTTLLQLVVVFFSLFVSVSTYAAKISSEKMTKPETENLQALHGKWQIVKAEEAGGPSPKEVIELIYTFEGETADNGNTSSREDASYLPYRSNQASKELTFTIIDEAGEKVVNNMIYAVEGDTLKLCVVWNSRLGVSKPFPKAFETMKGDRLSSLIVLKRAKVKTRSQQAD
jgi:uncharacterized protein (TIGR03067 family)